ncbi:MAG: signal peptidase II [Lachnospiraceae bacterium]|nr:signal peptidase II [Lachnospiraceae bacterium]
MKYLTLALGIFLSDSYIKNRVEKPFGKNVVVQEAREPEKERNILYNKIKLRKHHNKGVALNAFDKKQPVVAVVSSVLTALLGGALFVAEKNRENHGYRLGLAFLLGGAMSNSWDRLKRHYVVDYFSVNTKCKKLKDIVFNISDCFIMTGALLTAFFRK